MNDALDTQRLASIPARIPAVRRVVTREETGSTNDDARQLGAEGAPSFTIVIAGRQLSGRGRLGRTWYSPPGLGVYVSVLLHPRRPACEVARWTLAAAAAAAEACSETGARGLAIKWPNDLLASGRKVAGILAEMRTSGCGSQELVVGAGFNLFHASEDFPEELRARAGSLRSAGARPGISREELVEAWLARFCDLAERLERGDWDHVAARWSAWARGAVGEAVRVLPGAPGAVARTGVTRGLDPSGALRVEIAGGETIAVRLAESVQALEG
jgi:BirA family biotin operon repressor/biotin-[acetyl-CoA-carboxylase] ligase